MVKPVVRVFPGPGQAADFAAAEWLRLAGEAAAGGRSFTAAVSGGRTPAGLFARLAASPYPPGWNGTHLFLADERFVPPEHPDSNYGMLKALLLDKIDIPAGNVHPVPYTGSPSVAAAAYGQELRRHFGLGPGELPRFDLVLLGLGEDGHTASLFPGDRLASGDLAAPVKAPAKGYERITLTLPVLNNARAVVFLVTGAAKARAAAEVLKGGSGLPAALVAPAEGRVIFMLDRAAAGALP